LSLPTGSTVTPLSVTAYNTSPAAVSTDRPTMFSGSDRVSCTVRLSAARMESAGGAAGAAVVGVVVVVVVVVWWWWKSAGGGDDLGVNDAVLRIDGDAADRGGSHGVGDWAVATAVGSSLYWPISTTNRRPLRRRAAMV